MTNQITLLYDYNIWANDRVLQHLRSLPVEIFSNEVDLGFNSISEVIGHLANADEIWFARIKEVTPPPLIAKKFLDIEEASNYFNELQTLFRDYLLSIKDFEKKLTYRISTGQEFQHSISEIMHHVVNHGTYHRGNITTMLRYLGYKGIRTDYITYMR